jgi:hypothetical protein
MNKQAGENMKTIVRPALKPVIRGLNQTTLGSAINHRILRGIGAFLLLSFSLSEVYRLRKHILRLCLALFLACALVLGVVLWSGVCYLTESFYVSQLDNSFESHC